MKTDRMKLIKQFFCSHPVYGYSLFPLEEVRGLFSEGDIPPDWQMIAGYLQSPERCMECGYIEQNPSLESEED